MEYEDNYKGSLFFTRFSDKRSSFFLIPEMQDPSTRFQVIFTSYEVSSGCDKKDPRGRREGVPTDLWGEQTESQLRKSKSLAKRRLQKIPTKSKKMKRNCAEPCEGDIWQKTPRKRNFTKAAQATETEATMFQKS